MLERSDPVGSAESRRLRLQVRLLGIGGMLGFAAYTLLSYGLAPVLPLGSHTTEGALVAEGLRSLGWYAPGVVDFVTGVTFRSRTSLVLASVLPMLLCTVVAATLLIRLKRGAAAIDDAIARDLLRWSIAFGCVSALALPVMVVDFWRSFAWGRMLAAASNPYHADAASAVFDGLPIFATGSRMTYGPGWALLAGGVAALGAGKWWIEALCFKGLLLGAWIGILFAVDRLMRARGVASRAMAIAIAGWLPLGPLLGMAEGHNDVLALLGMALWLLALQRGSWTASSLLAASVTIKYVTAPLLVVDALYWLVDRRVSLRRYLVQGLVALAVLLTPFVLLFRSPDFFDAVRVMGAWKFGRPADALAWTLRAFTHDRRVSERIFDLVFLAWVALLGRRYWLDRTETKFQQLCLGVMALVLFTRTGHIWPWFVLWLLPLCALQAGAWLARFGVGVALAVPFVLLPWTFLVPGNTLRLALPTLLMYVLAWSWARLTRDRLPVGRAG